MINLADVINPTIETFVEGMEKQNQNRSLQEACITAIDSQLKSHAQRVLPPLRKEYLSITSRCAGEFPVDEDGIASHGRVSSSLPSPPF
jgi:hypothetical protein